MSQPRNQWKRQRQQQRTKHREAKRRGITQAATKRQRTRQQTPELWRSRVKGRTVRASKKRRDMARWEYALTGHLSDGKAA